MSAIRFFTDEDIYGAIAVALRQSGYDAVSTPEAGRTRASDASQLLWAKSEDRVLVTFNVAHFARLHAEWVGQGQPHSGLILSSQRPVGELLRRILHLAANRDAETMRNRLEFLGDW